MRPFSPLLRVAPAPLSIGSCLPRVADSGRGGGELRRRRSSRLRNASSCGG